MDGTIVRGDDPVQGAKEGLKHLRSAGLELLFVSNNPTRPPSDYVDRLSDAGFNATEREVLTSGTVTREYLLDHHDDAALFVIGEEGLTNQLASTGLRIVDDPEMAEVVVVSIDREFDYDLLCETMEAIDEETPFIGTDPDRVIPAADRLVPGSGAVINAVAGVVDREPDRMLGKPGVETRELALDRLGVPADEVLVVGDRLDTDIALGTAAGMTTALVLSGVTDREALADAPYQPDYVLDSLGEIKQILSDGT